MAESIPIRSSDPGMNPSTWIQPCQRCFEQKLLLTGSPSEPRKFSIIDRGAAVAHKLFRTRRTGRQRRRLVDEECRVVRLGAGDRRFSANTWLYREERICYRYISQWYTGGGVYLYIVRLTGSGKRSSSEQRIKNKNCITYIIRTYMCTYIKRIHIHDSFGYN